jgi:small ligand-binding sensory domain FIST
MYRAGLVGVAMCGDIEVDTIVAQGCRPIGEPMFVTGCQRNIVRELDGRPALKVLQELYQHLEARDQELFRHSLFLGIVMDESRQQYRQGDFLIRNIVGMDSATGALAIGAMLRESLVVQFHLRDAETSAEDLDELLARHARGGHGRGVEGSLLFSCLGRGAALYGRPDHDSEVFRRRLGEIPLGGFFCNGEIGPLHGSTFLHGYTSAFGLFRSRKPLA